MNKLIASLALAAVATTGWSLASAQTCAAPGAWAPDASGAPVLSGTTCGGNDEFVSLCQLGTSDNPHPDRVYQVTFTGDRTATTFAIGGGSATFNPLVGLYGGDCNNGSDTCAQVGATGETYAVTAASVPNGTYYLAVTAASFDAADACGDFTVTSNGTLPVSLVNFSVD